MPIALLPQISLALGFLFLGAGQQTFSTSNEAVAALVVSLFPRFPQSPGDQRCHLQVRPCAPSEPQRIYQSGNIFYKGCRVARSQALEAAFACLQVASHNMLLQPGVAHQQRQHAEGEFWRRHSGTCTFWRQCRAVWRLWM